MRVLANSIPKAGTHLLHACLAALPGLHDARLHLDLRHSVEQMRAWLLGLADGAITLAHLPYEPRFVQLVRATQVTQLLMVRDPRDVVVSYAEYVPRAPEHYLHAHFLALPPDERLLAAIVGVPGQVAWDTVALRDVGRVFAQFLAWRREPGTLVVRFEDLIGAAGGGDDARQQATVAAIAAHVGLRLSDADLEAAARRAYDPASPTFRRGRIGEWRARFGPRHRAEFERVAGPLLRELGYAR
jgi:hypothetical protein